MTSGLSCARCGTTAGRNANFCGTCGAALSASAEVAEDQLLTRLRQATEGEYDVLRELGRGGMAAVYLAWDRDLARHVAVKVLLPELAHHPGMSPRFLQEARTAANLDDHPSVVRVYRAKESDGLRYFVMKYVDGCSLDQLLRATGPLPAELATHVIDQVALALQYAHEHGVIHRDVKPGNILLDRSGGVVVTDFGIAKVAEAESLTRTGLAIGTPHYMSPEQWRVEPLSASSDQYALGVVAHHAVAGEVPFDGTQYEIQEGHLRADPTPLSELRPGVPTALDAVVARMLAKRPEERFPDLYSVSRALAAVPREAVPVLRERLALLIQAAPPSGHVVAGAPGRHLTGPFTSERAVLPVVPRYTHERLASIAPPRVVGVPRSPESVTGNSAPQRGAETDRSKSSAGTGGQAEPLLGRTGLFRTGHLREQDAAAAEPADHRALSVGFVLNEKYRLGAPLQSPSPFSITYAAYDLESESAVVIKEYFPRDLVDRGDNGEVVVVRPHSQRYFLRGITRFLDEADALMHVEHPNLARVTDAFLSQATGTAYLVMERHPGATLASLLGGPRNRLSVHAAVELMVPVLDGLDLAHSCDVVHRSISPASILVYQGAPAVLIGFGSARQVARDLVHDTGALPVSAYMAWEQIADNGAQVGAWTDVYACAAVLYRAITGRRPPLATDRHGRERLTSPNRLVPAVPRELSDVIVRGLAMQYRDRLQDAATFREQLRRVLSTDALPGTRQSESHDTLADAPQIFISFATADRHVAERVADMLEGGAGRVRCWLAQRDIKPGDVWSKALPQAIKRSHCVVLVHSARSNESTWVRREIKIAADAGIEVIAFRIEDVSYSDELELYLGEHQWLDAFTRPLDPHFHKLREIVSSRVL